MLGFYLIFNVFSILKLVIIISKEVIVIYLVDNIKRTITELQGKLIEIVS